LSTITAPSTAFKQAETLAFTSQIVWNFAYTMNQSQQRHGVHASDLCGVVEHVRQQLAHHGQCHLARPSGNGLQLDITTERVKSSQWFQRTLESPAAATFHF
jgi:hypothetical protein